MARPAKSANVMSGKISKADKHARAAEENRIKGNTDKIFTKSGAVKCPDYLTDSQKKIYKYIVDELRESGILGNLDIYILTLCAVAIDRVQYIEDMINRDMSLLKSSVFMASKEKYTKDFYRCCNELSLSPQSRAKLASINTRAVDDDPLRRALSDD